MILHDNARRYTAAPFTDILRRWQWEFLEYPPHSPDMSPYDYDLFGKVKESLRGTRYNTRGWSTWNINKNGRIGDLRLLINIWYSSIYGF